MPDGDAWVERSSLEMLRSVDPSGALVDRVVDAYLLDLPARVEAMQSALGSDDLSALRSAAHALKSSSGNVGAGRLAELLKQLEIAADSGETAVAAGVLAEFGEAVPAVVAALGALRAELGQGPSAR